MTARQVKRWGIPCIVFDGTSLRICDFNKDVIEELILALIQLVPTGNVTTYSSIARLLNIHPRTVALVLKRNKKPVVYPCHRVVRSDGYVGGYTLSGKRAVSVKEKLLTLEGVSIIDEHIPPHKIIDLTKSLLIPEMGRKD